VSEKEPTAVTVRILDKEYFVGCPPDERQELLDSAEYLNKKMREVRDTGKVVGADRIAVIAALNMANELLRLRKQDHELQNAVSGRVKNMRERVETALQRTRQLDLG
jgi:cell division protein ZapA